MPKYYRFRALTPTRKPKQQRDREGKEKGDTEKPREVKELEEVDMEPNFVATISLACPPVYSWYLRRIAWRQPSPLMGLPRMGVVRSFF